VTVFGKLLLISGNAEFLTDRTRARAVAAVKEEQPECEIATAVAGGLAPGELAGLISPSLFSSSSALVLTELDNLPEPAQDELIAYAASPSPDVAVVLVHDGSQKGKKLLDQLRGQSSITEVKVEAPKYEREFVAWVRTELRDLGTTIDEEAAALLVSSVGQDLRALAGAADQLASTIGLGGAAGVGAANGTAGAVTVEVVRRYFGGRADVRGFDIADAAIEGRINIALEQARWAEAARVAPVLITSAFASGLRSLAKLADAPDGLSEAELARHVGAPPFKIRILRRQLRAWDTSSLATALMAVAHADTDVKTGEADASYAVERMVLQVAAARRG
jgi:DNA polymerase-3 subunit delta